MEKFNYSNHWNSPVGYTNICSGGFSFTWKIENLQSTAFTVGVPLPSPEYIDLKNNHTWTLALAVVENNVYILVTLDEAINILNNTDRWFFLEFTILDKNFEPLYKKVYSTDMKKSAISVQFVSLYDLFDVNNNFVSDETLIIRCNFSTAVNQSCVKINALEFDWVKHQLESYGSFETFFNNKTLTDVTLVTNEEKIESHRIVLASKSPVFLAMFDTNMKEKKENIVEILDFSTQVIKAMLLFMYTGKIEDISEVAHDLFSCADKYSVQSLKDLCAHYIGSTLSVENITGTLQLADLHKCDTLKEKVCYFIATHKKDVINRSEFKILSKSNPVLINEVLCKLLLESRDQ